MFNELRKEIFEKLDKESQWLIVSKMMEYIAELQFRISELEEVAECDRNCEEMLKYKPEEIPEEEWQEMLGFLGYTDEDEE